MEESVFLFVEHMTALAENLHSKLHLCDNALRGNLRPPIADYSQRLVIDNGSHNMDWDMAEVSSEDLEVLIETLWSESQPLISDLLSLV